MKQYNKLLLFTYIKRYSCIIVNALGEIVLSKDYFLQKSKTITDNFNLKNLASGIYQLQVKSGDKISSVRFVK